MALTPIDVQQKTFRQALRGYAESEVDEFLDEVVMALREYESRLRDAEERIAVLEGEIHASRDSEDAFRKAFVTAQKSADSIVAEARVEAEKILEDARNREGVVAQERIEERDALEAELSRLRSAVGDLRGRLATLAGSMDEDLASYEQEMDSHMATGDEVEPGWPPVPEPVAPVDTVEEMAESSADDALDDLDFGASLAEAELTASEPELATAEAESGEDSGYWSEPSPPRPWERHRD